MLIDNAPEIVGPGANDIEAIPDSTGYSGEAPAFQEVIIDPSFPFGKPSEIDWTKIDAPGIPLLKELNIRSWVQSTEYCSGHPLDRPPNEPSELYPYVTGENVYEQIYHLDMAYMRGLVSDLYFRHRKHELREIGATRFYLNVNVYNMDIFHDWVKVMGSMLTTITNTDVNLLTTRYNSARPGNNYSIYWDYWTLAEREIIHAVALNSLIDIPV